MDSSEPKEARIRWGPDCPCEGQLLGERTCPGMPNDTLPWDVQKWLNRSICYLVLDLDELRSTQVQSYSPGCANVPSWEGTLVQPGEYDWTIHLRWQCSLVSYYFDHLLNINHSVRHHWCNTLFKMLKVTSTLHLPRTTSNCQWCCVFECKPFSHNCCRIVCCFTSEGFNSSGFRRCWSTEHYLDRFWQGWPYLHPHSLHCHWCPRPFLLHCLHKPGDKYKHLHHNQY